MRKGKEGFLLLMFCVYLACTSLLIMITVPFVFKVFQIMLSITQKNRILQTVDVIFFVVTNELHTTPAQQSAFKQLNDAEIIWVHQDIDIGLVYDEKTQSLFRLEGHYDIERKVWSSKHRSLVARNIKVQFKTLKASSVIFSCTVLIDSLNFCRIIIPQNRSYISRKM